jgi:hypothetical protein
MAKQPSRLPGRSLGARDSHRFRGAIWRYLARPEKLKRWGNSSLDAIFRGDPGHKINGLRSTAGRPSFGAGPVTCPRSGTPPRGGALPRDAHSAAPSPSTTGRRARGALSPYPALHVPRRPGVPQVVPAEVTDAGPLQRRLPCLRRRPCHRRASVGKDKLGVHALRTARS